MTTKTTSGVRQTTGRGVSVQDHGTPQEFLDAVEKRFGTITHDLAAHTENHKAPFWYGPGGLLEDSLSSATSWAIPGLLWLNPPFADIAPWAKKCMENAHHAEIVFLVPASVGAKWFSRYVGGVADVYLLDGRMSFDGKNVFPKDCLLGHFHPRADGSIRVWDWRKDKIPLDWRRMYRDFHLTPR